MSDFPQIGPPYQLLIKNLLDRPRQWTPHQEIVYRDSYVLTYRQFLERVERAAASLTRLGVRPGDRVGVMEWDSPRYLELFFAVPMLGAILHTVNIRLAPEQLHYTIHHAEDKFLLVHTDFLPLLESLAPRLPSVQSYVLLSDSALAPSTRLPLAGEYESLLAEVETPFAFPDFDENTIATLFYTTGTTGDPKGVFYSHRQLVLHTLAGGLTLAAGYEPVRFDARDVYMPLTPMFHVHAWGIPYMATLLGVKQVYPGRYEPQTILNLFSKHRPTLSHCVPTILQSLLHHPASGEVDFSGWKIAIGGSALSPALARQAMDRGIQILGAYGMSETGPIVATAHLKPGHESSDPDAVIPVVTRTGFPIPLARAAVFNPNDEPLPPGPEHVGELVLQAPWLSAGYYKDEARSRELWRGGWLHTGDIAYMDEDGYIRITDRIKDVIKVAGEWISSLELEHALSQHEAVAAVAVVAVPDPKWGERPLAEVVLQQGRSGSVSSRDLLHFLHTFIDRGEIHKRAVLTEIHFVEDLPRTSVGKIDKKAMRQRRQSSQAGDRGKLVK